MIRITILLACFGVGLVLAGIVGSRPNPTSEEWKQRRQEFFSNASFELPTETYEVLKHFLNSSYATRKSAHLPFYFDYELFKATYNRTNPTPEEDLRRNNVYITNCFSVFQSRAFYRMLLLNHDSNIDDMSDQYDESVRMDITSDTPLHRAIQMVVDEFKKVESANEIRWYLDMLKEDERNVFRGGKLPY